MEDELTELKDQVTGLYAQIARKGSELQAIEGKISQSVGPCLDAATPALRKRFAAERRQSLDERELLFAELDLLRRRLAETNEAWQHARNYQPTVSRTPVGPPRTLPAIPRR